MQQPRPGVGLGLMIAACLSIDLARQVSLDQSWIKSKICIFVVFLESYELQSRTVGVD